MSWGRFPDYPQKPTVVYWEDQVADSVTRLAGQGNTLAYGCGRSYGDSCLSVSDRVLQTVNLDRLLESDWTNGVVRAQAGMTIASLLDVSLPRGWLPAVSPGTRFVTLGGCVANDVHGKNHHRVGTFGCHVRRLAVYRSDRGVIECSSDDDPQLFAATIGGLGLTGVILWVEIQLLATPGTVVKARTRRFEKLSGFFELSTSYDADNEYSVSWVDCLADQSSLGRGHHTVANLDSSAGGTALKPASFSVPFAPPFSPINRWTLNLFNKVYYHRVPKRGRAQTQSLAAFFYPLDAIDNWNRLYGRAGFQQYQCLVPLAAAPETLERVLFEIRQRGRGSFLSVLKRCGDRQSPGLLSFPAEGITLAMDFPQGSDLRALFMRLDDIVHGAGGRLYPAKDAHMQSEHFKQAYPHWPQVESHRDPVLMSRFWHRVTGQ